MNNAKVAKMVCRHVLLVVVPTRENVDNVFLFSNICWFQGFTNGCAWGNDKNKEKKESFAKSNACKMMIMIVIMVMVMVSLVLLLSMKKKARKGCVDLSL